MGRSGRVAALVATAVAVAAALTPVTAAPATSAGRSSPWSWPLRPVPVVVREATLPASPWLPGHRGVDLAAAPGQQVLAPAAGTVTFAGTVVDRGVLTITHAGGLRSSVEPVTATVPVGTGVQRGDVVALVEAGGAHCPAVGCLHWGVRRGSVYVDPLLLLRPADPPVLLPLRPRVPRSAHLAQLGAQLDHGLGVHLADP